ncbi:DUF1351 domain-containing protein [Lactobacillus acidophilus]|uniref:DUF1351 domain-containing protein n=1 Tax=Lactobacillus acidophilus TaxID=1579 RepID=UPI0021A267AD|nr:DUF1351 domain-containing protein [Lactobacillus acidophilus]MCT3603206.1 DUF1351 domain-containing protein [Lactobacillus acidophilus]MCT3624189.1 DUF1351 domain-containing protein [Lactobacillus acidophilus]
MNENQLIKLDENAVAFPVNFAPAQIDFSGYRQMKDQIDQLHESLEKYDVTQDNLKDAKSTRAKLNKLVKAIKSRKVEIKKKAEAPVKDFNDKVESLVAEIDDSSTKISAGIKVFEDKEKQAKHEKNLKHIAAVCELAGIDPSKIKYQSSWDNKSYSQTKFETDVDQQIGLFQEWEAQYADRVKIISEQAEKLALPADHWIKELDTNPLSKVLSEMSDYKNDLAAVSKAQKETKLDALKNLKKQGDKYIDLSTGEIKEKIITLPMKVKGTKWQLEQLRSFLNDNGIEYHSLED